MNPVPSWRRIAVSVVVMIGVYAVPFVTQADAALYWGENGTVGAANLDGSAADLAYFNPLSYLPISGGARCGVAVNSRYLYWLGSSQPNSSQIGRVNLDGPTVAEPIVSGLSGACALAASESHLYWTNAESGTIGRANLDGTEVNSAFLSGIDDVCGVAVDEHHIYWTGRKGVGRANLEGGEVEPAFIPETFPCGVVVTGHYIFWAGASGKIGRAEVDGSEVNPEFITGGAAGLRPYLAADATHVYWTNWTSGGLTPSTVGRANIDGTEVNQKLVVTARTDALTGLAVDSRPSLPELPLASRPISFGKVRHNGRTGVIFVNVQAWEGDTLSVMSPAISWKILKPKSSFPPEAPVQRRLKLWPGTFGGAARHIQSQLKRIGRAPFNLRLIYSEPGKTVEITRKRLVFVRRGSRIMSG